MIYSTRRPRRILSTLAVAACLAASWPAILSTPAALATNAGPSFSNGVYSFTSGGCQTWQIPTGVTQLLITSVGASGGSVAGPSFQVGGTGDGLTGLLTGLAPGNSLDVCVDYGGGVTDGSLHAQAGGGASGVSLGQNFSQPVIVAGGGGGSSIGGGDPSDVYCCSGGSAGFPAGSAGHGGVGTATGGGGGGGTAAGAGSGGGGDQLSTSQGNQSGGANGGATNASGPGIGGAGGTKGAFDTGGGGGGAGYYGGGGGGATGGAGGGGSDWCKDTYTGGSGLSPCKVSSGAGTGVFAGSGAGDAQVRLQPITGCLPGYSSGICTAVKSISGLNSNGWANGTVTVTLESSDSFPSRPDAAWWYSIDDPQCTPPSQRVIPVPHCQPLGLVSSDITDYPYQVDTSIPIQDPLAGSHTLYFFGDDHYAYEQTRHTVTFKIDKTAPTVTPVLTHGTPCSTAYTAGAWSDTPVCVHWNISDPNLADGSSGSGVDTSTTNCPDQTITEADSGVNGITVYCAAYDLAGNSSGQVSSGVIKVDQTSPTVSCGSADTSWHLSNVSVTCTASDAASGLDSSSPSQFSLSTSVGSNTYSTTAVTTKRQICDVAGNCVTAGPVGPFKIDTSTPNSGCTRTQPSGQTPPTWSVLDYQYTCTPTDPNGPGLDATNSRQFTLSTSAGGGEGPFSTTSQQVCDIAGSCISAGPFGPFNIDQKAPSISITSPADGGTYLQNNAITPAYSCTDGGSGVVSANCTDSAGGTSASPGAPPTDTTGKHTYTVYATDNAGNQSKQSVTYTVSGIITLTPATGLTATEGTSTGGITVATITDTDGDPCTNFHADITNWGDGNQTKRAPINGTNATTGCAVLASNTYSEYGSYTISVSVSDGDGTSKTGSAGISVADAPLGQNENPAISGGSEGNNAQYQLAAFADTAGVQGCTGNGGEYTATISWGDTSSSSGQVSNVPADACSFVVSASHTYAEHGSYGVTVTIQEADNPNSPVLTVNRTIAVADQQLQAGTSATPAVTEGQTPAGSGILLGSITDPGGGSCPTTAYKATITWNAPGAGSSTGTLVPTGSCAFNVYGTLTPSSPGAYYPSVSVYEGDDQTDSAVTLTPTLTVADAPLTASGGGSTTCSGLGSCMLPLGSFSDANPLCASEGTLSTLYRVTVSDGSNPIGTGSYTRQGSSCSFTVSYAASSLTPGNHSFTYCVQETDGQGSSACTNAGSALGVFVNNLSVLSSGAPSASFALTLSPVSPQDPCAGTFSGQGVAAGSTVPTEQITGSYYGNTVYFLVTYFGSNASYWGTLSRGSGGITGSGKDSGGVTHTYVASSSVLLQASQLGCLDLVPLAAGTLTPASANTTTTRTVGSLTDADGFSAVTPDLTVTVAFGDGSTASCTGAACLSAGTANNTVRLVGCQPATGPALPGSAKYGETPLDVSCSIQATHRYTAANATGNGGKGYQLTLSLKDSDQSSQPAPVYDYLAVT